MEIDADKLVGIKKEIVEIKKQKLQLLVKDSGKREREENDLDKLFLVSLLHSLKRIPERQKSNLKIKLQPTMHEGTHGSCNDEEYNRSWKILHCYSVFQNIAKTNMLVITSKLLPVFPLQLWVS